MPEARSGSKPGVDNKSKDTPAPLDEVMLAMDVVDTLRHRRQLVERELHSGDRDRALMKRLKEIYAEQGIAVPDKVLAEGVAALREDRFSYQPPKPGFVLKLARLYVNRGRWYRGLGLGALVASILGISYHYSIGAPEAQKLEQRITRLNSQLDTFGVDLGVETARVQRLRDRLVKAGVNLPTELAGAAGAREQQAQSALQGAQGLVEQARQLPAAQRLDAAAENLEAREARVMSDLAKRQALLVDLRETLNEADQAIQEIEELKAAARELPAARDAVRAIAKEAAAISTINEHYASGTSALRLGDLPGVRSRLRTLQTMRNRLDQAYRLLVVSRPGERSGVWRVPDANESARNYYLIVEAVTPGGERLAVAVMNEETGSVEQVRQWGVRVNQADFDRIAADKQDDGIIQDNEVGTKRRGFLEPHYELATSGAAITRW